MSLRTNLGLAGLTWLVIASLAGCTLEDVYDEVRVVATVPPPQSTDTPHRITRRIKLAEDTDRIEDARIELVRISVLEPEDTDLSIFLGIRLYIKVGEGRAMLAQTSGIQPGVRSLELDIEYTGDLTGYLESSSLQLEWEVYYRSTASFPSQGVEIETVIGFNADVELL